MRELLLFRHAKSSWDQPGVPDRERALAPRGIEAAARMGDLMRGRGLVPDLVLCSTARRAVQTWQLAGEQLGRPPAVIHVDALYLASPDQILAVARDHGVAAHRLLLVGHNPGMHVCANRLAATGEAGIRARLAAKFPTAGLAWFRFAIGGWRELAAGSGDVLGFWRPRDLGAAPT